MRVEGRMGGWTDVWVGGWTDDGKMNRGRGGEANGRISKQHTDGQTDARREVRGQRDAWVCGTWMDRWKDRSMNNVWAGRRMMGTWTEEDMDGWAGV